MTTSTTTRTNGYRHDSDPPQTVEFLKLLWGNGDQSGKILIWSLNTKRSLWLKTPSQAARFQSQPNIFTGMAKSADVERSPTRADTCIGRLHGAGILARCRLRK